MKLKKIAAVGAAFVMAAGIVTGVPAGTENVPSFAVTAEAADSKLAAPKNLKAAAGDGKVTLTWDKVSGADAYRVYLYNAETKKYEKCKSVKSAKATVTGLENGKTYKFKVAAAVKSGKSYKTGKTSAAVSAKPETVGKAPEKSETKNEKPKMKEVNLSSKELVGSWVYYDFWLKKKYTAGTSYDPNKIQFNSDGYLTQVLIIDEKTAVISIDTSEYGKMTVPNTITNNKISDSYFKVYSYGEDKYLFLQFINDNEHTYIFKYAPIVKSQVTDVSKLNGRWTATDYCDFELKYSDSYNPLYPLWSAENMYVTGAIASDGKISIATKDGNWVSNEKISSDKIGASKYYVYDINGTLYMYYQFINGDGDKQFYVLKKN